MTYIILNFLPLAGVIIGACLHYLFTRSSEADKNFLILRQKAYADYLESIAESAFTKNDELRLIQKKAAEAKTRMVIYGDKSVILALSDFEIKGAKLDNPDSIKCFVTLIKKMRFRKDQIEESHFLNILLGVKTKRLVLK